MSCCQRFRINNALALIPNLIYNEFDQTTNYNYYYILLNELGNYGISGRAESLLTSYLSHTQQIVKFPQEWCNIGIVVSQGMIL